MIYKNKKVLGIALNPELETIVRIAKIPLYYESTSKELTSLIVPLNNLDAIIVSPSRKTDIELKTK